MTYFFLGFFAVASTACLLVFAVYTARTNARSNRSVRIEYCQELEKLKTQNREDVVKDKRNYRRNLRLFHLTDTPELHRIAAADWAEKLARNAPKSCPYTGHAK